MIDLKEVKTYLRVDFDDEDKLIKELILTSENHCLDIARVNKVEEIKDKSNFKIAVLYMIAYLYENREDADHTKLNLTLRALLFGSRKDSF